MFSHVYCISFFKGKALRGKQDPDRRQAKLLRQRVICDDVMFKLCVTNSALNSSTINGRITYRSIISERID